MKPLCSFLAAGLLTAVFVPSAAARPGDLDPSFSGDGIETLAPQNGSARANAVEVRPDGRIVAAGSAVTGGRNPRRLAMVAQFLPNGSVDQSFGSDAGALYSSFGAGDNVSLRDFEFLPDGRIAVVGGTFVARLLPNGALDTSFAGDGVLESQARLFGGVRAYEDGSLVVATMGALVGLSADGALDPKFSDDGIEPLPPELVEVQALQEDAGGRTIVVGTPPNYPFEQRSVARYSREGAPEPSFAGDGLYSDRGGNNYPFPITRAQDGGVVIGGTSCFGSIDIRCTGSVTKLSAAGERDQAFAGDGLVTEPYAINAVDASDPTGVVTAASAESTNGDLALQVIRYRADGVHDPAYPSAGRLAANPTLEDDTLADFARGSDGRLVAAGVVGETLGRSEGELAVMRFRMDDAPADSDADGVTDDRDVCPGRYGAVADGCPRGTRRLEIEPGEIRREEDGSNPGTGITGVSITKSELCKRVGAIDFYVKRSGVDRRLGEAVFTSGRRFQIRTGRLRGRVYSKSRDVVRENAGRCVQTRSNTVRLAPGG